MRNYSPTLLWNAYNNYVCSIVSCNTGKQLKDISYWRNDIFCKMLIYITPMSIIALVPSVFLAFRNGLYVIAISDLVAFSLLLFVTVIPNLSLALRKMIFIGIFYILSVILLYFHGSVGAGMLFLLTLTILTAIIYSQTGPRLFQRGLPGFRICNACIFLPTLTPPSKTRLSKSAQYYRGRAMAGKWFGGRVHKFLCY